MAGEKARLDQALVARGLVATRTKAQALISAGLVRVDGVRSDKASILVTPGQEITLEGQPSPYVSRGGIKLAHALAEFPVEVAGKIVLDVGAATGGFTDCLLQNGASLVYALDVGYGQLAWKLRQDPRVRCYERTNIRYVQASAFDPRPQLATVDVAFISLRHVFPVLKQLLVAPGQIITLIKPQFEAGREHVGKKGVVRDPKVHVAVLTDLTEAAKALGYQLRALTYSPITGPEGNIEFLALWELGAGQEPAPALEAVVKAAWSALK